MAYILSCCSTADLSREHFESRDIHYICFHFFLDGKAYPDDLGESIPFDKFYAAMANGADTRTSQINTDEFIAYFTPFLEEGKDILHVSLSSGISGVSNSATLAAKELSEKYFGHDISPGARYSSWTPLARPPATALLWISLPTFATRARA